MKQFFNTPSKIMTGALCLLALLAVPYAANASLTHQYSFNDVITSTNAIDSAGGATGDLYPGATYPGDGTVVLDGVSGFIYLPDDIVSNYTSVTYEAWTTPTSNPTWARLFDFGTNQGGKGTGGAGGTGGNGVTWQYVCLQDGAGGNFRAEMNPGGAITGPQPAAGLYHHIVFTIDASAQTAALFDNGVLVSFSRAFTATPQAVGHTFNDYIGRSQFPDPYFNGSIDEFRIYNNALTPVQVEADFEAGANSTAGTAGALNSIQFSISTNVILGAVLSPNVLANYAQLTNNVNITTLPGIAYSSSNTNVVSVGVDGNFHAVGLGSATLQATYLAKTGLVIVFVAAEPTVLKHRYGFGEAAGATTIIDSVGGANGTLINPSPTAALTGSGQLTLDGNASSGYVDLPPGMVSSLTNATFQVWVTWYGGPVWQELYSFGTNFNGGGVNYTTLIPHNGANGNLRWSINEAGETVVDGPSALVISNEICVTVAYNYSAQSAALYLGGRKVGSGPMNKPLYTIQDVNNYIGKSQFSADAYFQGAVDELRIYSGVKSELQIAIDAATGPDTIVTNPGALLSLNVTVPNTNLDVHGLSVPVQVVANFANVSGVDVTTMAGTSLAISDTSVATIVQGNLVPQAVGSATVTATFNSHSGSVAMTVVDTNGWPALLHRYSFSDAQGTTVADSVGGINGTLNGPGTFNGSQLVMPAGNPPPDASGLPTASSGWVSFPAGQNIVSGLPNEASFECWVVWSGGGVWQEMFDFGAAATPGISLGGGNYVMVSPHDGATGALRSEWFPGGTVLTGPSLQSGVLSQVVLAHDQDRQLDKLYLNGQLVASGANTRLWSSLPDTDNWLARDQWPDPMFNGRYDDLRIWNGALTASQVADLYKAGPNVIAGPELKISAATGQITLKWPANATGFVPQSNTNLVSGTWSAVPGTPTVVNGLNNLTISAGQSQIYYRLKQ